MSIYFDRTVPFYLTDVAGFNATKVSVPVKALKQARQLRALVDLTERKIVEGPGPESYDQELAEFVAKGLADIFKGKSSGSK